MSIYNIIEKKKRSEILTREEIEYFIAGVTDGSIEDSAIGSFLMAVCINGMNANETYYLTMAMVNSGDICDLSGIDGVIVDKHSSGGVSDSTTLLVASLVSCLGLKVAKMSGRGLGHTGGTIDKLESFNGYRAEQDIDSFKRIVNEVGVSIIAQTGELVPADKKLYAIRDVSATVKSIPLIASSIMSKKIASGVKNIVLDVKYGSGAFIKEPELAIELAKLMVAIGEKAERKVVAFVTSMQQPLGNFVGCNLEMREVLEILNGERQNDLYTLGREIAAKLLVMTGTIETMAAARDKADAMIVSKRAFSKLKEIIAAHDGDVACFDDMTLLKNAPCTRYVTAEKDGILTAVATESIGLAVSEIGGGRKHKTDRVDHTVGIATYKRLGETVETGETLATIYAELETDADKVTEIVRNAYTVGGHTEHAPLIYAEVTASGVRYDATIEKIVKRTENIMSYSEKLELEAENFKFKTIAAAIEHTLLSQTATPDMIKKQCDEAKENGFAAVCIQPIHVAHAKKCLEGSAVKVCTVVGFPYGETLTKVKVLETKQAVRDGADEIDMVISVSHAKQGDFKYITKEISRIVKAARNHTVKVIIEASQLTKEEIIKATDAVIFGGAQYVKTSTGLFGKGATAENVELIANEIKKQNAANVGIKAAGGIRDAGDVYELMNKGASRIGTSNSLAIIAELKQYAEDKKQEIQAKKEDIKITAEDANSQKDVEWKEL